MGFLLLAILLQISFGQIVKWSAIRGWSINAVGLINYLVASAVAASWAGACGWQCTSQVWGHGILAGLGLSGALLAYDWLVPRVGIALPTGAVRASIMLPVVAYIIFAGERPSPLQLVGIGLIGLAAPIVAGSAAIKVGGTRTASLAALAAVFIAAGVFQLDFRVFQRSQGQLLGQTMWPYMTIAFASAAVAMAVRVKIERPRFGFKVLWAGVLLGLANVLALGAYLTAMRAVDLTYVVFPVASCGGVIGTTLLAVLAWGEKLDRHALLGLLLAVVALALIQAG